VKDLEVREIDGGEYVVAVNRQEGLPATEVLSALLRELLASLRFSKSMRWNASNVAFSRPVRWLVALLGDAVVPFEYAGLISSHTSRSSRPQDSAAFEIARADDYLGLLAERNIVVDPVARRAVIAEQAAELATSVGGAIPDDPALLDEVTNLVEQPTALLGHFEEEYLKLPAAVLIAVMKKHQRYFPIVDGDGSLMSYFVVVRNGGEEHLDSVRHGNEEVIRARFADADFFYREDSNQSLEDFLPRLDTLTFQEQLGSMLDKTRRLEKLVDRLTEMLGLNDRERKAAQRAAHLCKADLATQMVVEFTSLQGVMGREYALRSGEDEAVAQAIYEHYLPRYAGDALPETKPGLVVGLANRLDSLAGLFAAGLAPTGSSDPYHLRRDALSVVQNLLAHELSFSVRTGLEAAAALMPVMVSDESLAAALDFVVERLRGVLREDGFAYDAVDAVLAAQGHDPFRARQAVEQLAAWVTRDDWSRILENYARCVRITRDYDAQFRLDPARFEQPAEETLHAAYQEARARVTPQSSVDGFLTAFVPLVDVIDAYFARESGVLVMDEDRTLRENRLAQLRHIAALAEGVVDLSRMERF
jgi:glycyl-tRNA synthetase